MAKKNPKTGLTDFEEGCCHEYVRNGGNQTAAFLSCHQTASKWKRKTVKERASKLFRSDNVQATIQAIRLGREYRTGQLSNNEIAKQFRAPESSLRTRAKTKGWANDLSPQVKQKVKENLLHSIPRTKNASDEEIIYSCSYSI